MGNIIGMDGKSLDPTVDKDNNTIIPNKCKFWIDGVQIWENGKLTGVALYQKTDQARLVRDILNRKYAELKVNHEAKILKYPVY